MSIRAGEDSQDQGRDGLHEAKRWLEMSTRVSQSWTHSDGAFAELLGFSWPHGGGTFTFDLGGVFRGDSLEGQSFVAEVKKYRKENDLSTHFRDFLAKCYVALITAPNRCDNFLWISWAPFQAQKWDEHTSIDRIKAALLHNVNCERLFGTADTNVASSQMDASALFAVSQRIWLLTLADKQVDLVLTKDHYLEVVKLVAAEAI